MRIITLFLLLVIASLGAASERVTYIHVDPLGTPVLATDQTGDVEWYGFYEPYGRKFEETAASLDQQSQVAFTGHIQDAESGLVYTGARYYNPDIGRFLSPDPEYFTDHNPASFNRYAYANNNPYRYTDPNGESPIDVAFLAYDVGKLVFVAATGGNISEAAVDVGLSVVGVLSPVPGTGLALKAQRANRAKNAVINASEAGEHLVQLNRKVGKNAEAFLKRQFGGGPRSVQTSLGRRDIDNFVNGIAMESKVGRVSANARIRKQIAKDAELLRTPNNAIDSVEWVFFPGKTGVGPTATVRQLLQDAGIKILYREGPM